MDLSDTPSLLPPGVHIYRVDYGYPGPSPSRPGSSQTLDLSRIILPPSEDPQRRVFLHLAESPPRLLLLKSADRLLAWERLRGKGDGIREVKMAATSAPVVLLCRFPRHATALQRAFEDAETPTTFRETPRDGSLPPLYRGWDPDDPRVRLHLELEWVSALACARGDAALEQVGLLLSSAPLRGSSVASGLGITQGAARSYLQWMEDVALVRREGRLFDLAHPLLGTRFKELAAPEKPLQHPPNRVHDDMSVD